MKKTILTLVMTTLFVTLSFGLKVSSGSSIKNNQEKDEKTPVAMNQMPVIRSEHHKKEISIDQPKQEEQLVGSNASTWTPAYVKVKGFKKCLKTQEYRGWKGYCFPKQKPKKCPDDSWKELAKMNMVPCSE